jgi:hypothetical protein
MSAGLAITTNTNTSVTGTWTGGRGNFSVSGTFDSATVKLQYSRDGTNWLDVGSDTTLTAAGGGNFDLPGGTHLRVNSAGGGGSLSVIAHVAHA